MMQQIHPIEFFKHLVWLDGRPLLEVMEPYRQKILTEALYTFRPDGSPLYRRVLTGRAKKNSKTTDAVLAALYKCLVWKAHGDKGNEVYFIASDLAQANDDLDLTKKIVRRNPVLEAELMIKSNVIERRDGKGFIEILPAGDAQGLHGKTYLLLVADELHVQEDYRVLEALEIDRTRPDTIQFFASYASHSRQVGMPINDMLKQHEAKSDPRLYVSWYTGTVEEANPSLNGPLGPTMNDIEDARRSLPSWIFRRLYQNLGGQPDGAAFNADAVEAVVMKGRKSLPPQAGIRYRAFVDMSGGGADDSTLAIAHQEHGKAVLDLVMDQGARRNDGTFSPDGAVKKFADVLKMYRIHKAVGDRYAGEWPREAFRKLGIHYEVSEKNRSELYASLEPLVNAGTVELLDHPKVIQQLIGLVLKGNKIQHASSEHDDHCNSAAGALVAASVPARVPGVFVIEPLTEEERMSLATH